MTSLSPPPSPQPPSTPPSPPLPSSPPHPPTTSSLPPPRPVATHAAHPLYQSDKFSLYMVAAAPGDSAPPPDQDHDAAALHDRDSDDATEDEPGVATWFARAVLETERARRQYVAGLWGERPRRPWADGSDNAQLYLDLPSVGAPNAPVCGDPWRPWAQIPTPVDRRPACSRCGRRMEPACVWAADTIYGPHCDAWACQACALSLFRSPRGVLRGPRWAQVQRAGWEPIDSTHGGERDWHRPRDFFGATATCCVCPRPRSPEEGAPYSMGGLLLARWTEHLARAKLHSARLTLRLVLRTGLGPRHGPLHATPTLLYTIQHWETMIEAITLLAHLCLPAATHHGGRRARVAAGPARLLRQAVADSVFAERNCLLAGVTNAAWLPTGRTVESTQRQLDRIRARTDPAQPPPPAERGQPGRAAPADGRPTAGAGCSSDPAPDASPTAPTNAAGKAPMHPRRPATHDATPPATPRPAQPQPPPPQPRRSQGTTPTPASPPSPPPAPPTSPP